ncbi:hypothetical protein QCA50_005064 [Cerrena zonata]|uniref:DUF6535 domain-containing protein n=1 Tax=Cerrena zonata TaxID=2478898 RepID=A0AAW0GEF3_9APHY
MTSNSLNGAVASPLGNEVATSRSTPSSLNDRRDRQDAESIITGHSSATGNSAFSAGDSYGDGPPSESEPGEGGTDKGSLYDKIIEPQTKVQVDEHDTLFPKISDTIQRVQIEPEHKGWARLSNMVREYDEAKIRDVKEDIDTLLVFAGLFSAVLTAFVVETYDKLQDDSGDTASRALIQISAQLASLGVMGNFINSTVPSYTLTPFSPPHPFVRINTLWSCSLVISLVTASFGIFVKQWLHEYMAQETQSPLPALRIRFFRNEGLADWRVFELAAALPLLLQIALLLFLVGLSEFLRELNPVVGWVTTGILLLWIVVFIFTTLAPILSSQCPYKTPILKGALFHLRGVFYDLLKASVEFLRHPLTDIGSIKEPFFRSTTSFFHRIRDVVIDPVEHMLFLVEVFGRAWRRTVGDFSVEQPPEEYAVKSAQDFKATIGIISSSVALFPDEQLVETIGECTANIAISSIVALYKEVTSPEPNYAIANNVMAWKSTLSPDAEAALPNVLRDVLIYKLRHIQAESTIFEVWRDLIKLIIQPGTQKPLWYHLPTVIFHLLRSGKVGHGIFEHLHTIMTQDSFPNFGMYDIWDTSEVKAGVLYIDWLNAETRRRLQRIRDSEDSEEPSNRDPHTFSRESTSLCYIFSNLLLLASSEALVARKDDLKALTSEILEVLNDIPDLYSTKAVNDQMWYSREALQKIQERCREAISEALIAKLVFLWGETFRGMTHAE